MAIRRIVRSLGGIGLAACAVAPILAAAQTSDARRSGSPGVQSDLGEVVVTSRKREENVQEVPISLSVLGADEIDARGAIRIRDLAQGVPNINFVGGQNASLPLFSIRGIISQTRVSPGFESSAGVYVDGVVIGRLTGFSQELYDVERVEFLRGPQGTLFGRNSIAGAINVVTRQPTADPRIDAEIEIGDFETRGVRLYGTSALGSERVLGSLALTWRESDGFQKNVTNGDVGDNDDLRAARAKLLVRATDAIDVTLSADALRDRAYSQGSTGIGGYGATGARDEVSQETSARAWRDIEGGSATVDADVGALGTLTFIAGYRSMDNDRTSDTDGGPIAVAATRQIVETTQRSGELRLASGEGRLQYVLGAFWFDQDASNSTDACGLSALPAALRGCGTTFSRVETQSKALFANVDFGLTEALRLSAGVRWTDERKDLGASQTAIVVNPIAIPFETDRISDTDVSPTVGVNYALGDSAMLYATAARGYRSGGWNTEIVTSNPRSIAAREFSEESMWNYEVGLKSQWWDRRLTVNAAVFQMNYDDMQVVRLEPFFVNGVQVPGALVSAITNAGESRIRGAELEFRVQPAERLSLSGGIGYVDAEYTSYTDRTGAGAALVFTGNKLDAAPEFTYNLAAAYEYPLGPALKLSAGVDWNKRSSYYRLGGRANNPVTDLLPGYALLNGRIGVVANSGRWEAYVLGSNLTNSVYRLGAGGIGLAPFTPSGTTAIFGRPRYLGLRFAVRFD